VEISLDERWSIGGKPHGGYLLRHAVAPVLTDDHPHPLAVSAHFLRSPDPGPASIEVETLRTGRRVSQHRTRIVQGETCVETLVTSGSLDPDAEPFWSAAPPPELPPLADCFAMPAEPSSRLRIGFLDFVDVRADPATVGFARRTTSSTPGSIRAHLQMKEGGSSPLDLLVLADALPPVTFDLGVPGWVPTVELTVLIRAVPAPGWLVAEQRAQLLEDGWLDEECSIWDARGRLVCQARQLAGYRLRT
jgi:acyl-CoA thioesterase